MFTKLYAATWGEVGKAKEKGFLILIDIFKILSRIQKHW